MNDESKAQKLFELFIEIGIIDQLSNTIFNRCMPLGLSVAHFGVINHMVRLGDGCTPVALADAFQVTRPTMTSTLSRLAELGLISMAPNPQDGRSKLVTLTAAGRRFREDSIAALAPDLRWLAAKLDVPRLLALLPDLQTLRRTLDANRQRPHKPDAH